MRRREFIAFLGGAAAWPLAAPAQQREMAVIGFLHRGSESRNRRGVATFRQGLLEAGYVEGRNIAIEFRWANLQFAQLPTLANDLVHRQVAVIVAAGGIGTVQAAKSATSTVAIVSVNGFDLVKYGFAESLNRPGGNVTGITVLGADLMAKRVGLLHDLLPRATTFAFLSDGSTSPVSEDMKNDMLSAARMIGLEAFVVSAGDKRTFATAFATLAEREASGLIVGDHIFSQNAKKIASLAAQHKIPAIYPVASYARVGGLMSYGADIATAFRQVAIRHVGPILKGAKAADLPIEQATKFELVINRKAAAGLGVEIPPALLIQADEVIE
jgi:putative tryptophan/tyrosine transport system substrate-binding protein